MRLWPQRVVSVIGQCCPGVVCKVGILLCYINILVFLRSARRADRVIVVGVNSYVRVIYRTFARGAHLV